MAQFGVKEVMDVTFYDIKTGKPVLFVDTLKMTNLENTAESVSARGGKGNPKLLTWDFNREATMAVQDALLSPKSLSMLTGVAETVGATNIHKRQELTLAGGKVTLAETPVGSVMVYKIEDGNETEDSGTASGKDVTIAGGEDGDTYAVYYQYSATNAATYTVSSKSFPGYYKVVGDTVVRNAATGADEAFQIVIEKAKLQPGFTLTFQAEGDPSVFDMNLEVFKPESGDSMVKMIKY